MLILFLQLFSSAFQTSMVSKIVCKGNVLSFISFFKSPLLTSFSIQKIELPPGRWPEFEQGWKTVSNGNPNKQVF